MDSAQDSDLTPFMKIGTKTKIKPPLDRLNLGVSFKSQGTSGVTKKSTTTSLICLFLLDCRCFVTPYLLRQACNYLDVFVYETSPLSLTHMLLFH